MDRAAVTRYLRGIGEASVLTRVLTAIREQPECMFIQPGMHVYPIRRSCYLKPEETERVWTELN